MTLAEEIGAKIKYYRKKRGLKIAELAALLHKTGANAYDREGITVKTAQTRMNTGFLTCHFAL